MRISKNVLRQSSSPFSDITSMKNEYKGSKSIIDTTEGLPNFRPTKNVKNQIINELLNKDLSTYTQRNGLIELRQLIAKDINSIYECDINEENILITSGCNNAFTIAINTLFNQGDEVLLPNPFYFNHFMWLDISGISIKNINTNETNYKIDIEILKKNILKKTRGIVITNPSNPTGINISSELILGLMKLCQSLGIYLILDETYRMNTPDKHNLFSLKDWHKTLVSLNSLSKEFALCGYRIGYIVSSFNMIKQFQKVSECMNVCPSHIGQIAAIESLKNSKEQRLIQTKLNSKKAKYFIDNSVLLGNGFRLKSAGVYFAWIEYLGALDTKILVRELFLQTGVLSLPGSLFTRFNENLIRISFSKLSYSEIDELIDRLSEFSIK